ncbi:MAG: 2,3-bisphosphoglycerate-independent phosphoglycerate mutase [Gammaproteobacteria bacterium]|nr:2,3-bisphosphoglycerate-independent phosphoglycerate mutase [Gammaproteobacteria bacterium]
MTQIEHPVMLIVLDGWGHSDDAHFNAIHGARKPTWDGLWSHCPHTLIRCSGEDVGLPDDQMGNSEVGHMHLGAGRLVYQDYTRISKAIRDGDFFANPVLKPACERAAALGRAVHVMGLLSPGGVHSHEEHIVALMKLAASCGVKEVNVHGFLDGRDMPPKSAGPSIELIERTARELGVGRLATLCGRYYAMDRNKSWERTQIAYDMLVDGVAEYSAADGATGLEAAYARGETDEFVKPTVLVPAGGTPARIRDGDVVVFANFRADRARQITSALTDAHFDAFARTRVPQLDAYVCMTDYGAQFQLPIAYPAVDLTNTFGAVVGAHGLKQLRIAETEKYAHVTFFFNAGEETPFPGEDRILVASPKVATYDLKPEMSAVEVTDALEKAILDRKYDTIICNYANADMVGHTGDYDAAVKCIETLDACLGRLVAACRQTGMEILITADHGNAEQMRATPPGESEQPHTAHTTNLVPLVYVGRKAAMADSGALSDIAPTMLALMGLPQPGEMTGRPLVKLEAGAQQAA